VPGALLPRATERRVKTILFTGFPGFIGMRLLPRVLELQPETHVACLVQEKFIDAARRSLAALVAGHAHTHGRVELVAGDITQAGLGIAAGKAAELRRSLWQAWHLAAVYDLAVTRELGRRVNVEGTRNVLDFAAAAPRFERLQYASTAYVSGTARGVFRETDLDVGQGFKNHYEETKFQAEIEVVRSRIPATIYRPGVVVGDSKTGETAKFDGPYLVLSLMERLPSPGVFFRVGTGGGRVNIVPVDFVVEAMARLAASSGSGGRTYHLCDPQPHSPVELVEMFAEAFGKRFLFVPVPLAVARACFAPRPVQRFFGMPQQAIDYFQDAVRHDTAQASRDLGTLGVECPRLSDYLPRLIAFYRSHHDAVRREAMA
jgi:thioester reductase-like protein